jgi:hypothetical protein
MAQKEKEGKDQKVRGNAQGFSQQAGESFTPLALSPLLGP